MITPSIAKKLVNFSANQKRNFKTNTDMIGQTIFELNRRPAVTIFDATIELVENKIYSFTNDLQLTETFTIEDSSANSFDIFILNTQTIVANSVFKVRIKGTTAYLYT